MMEATCEAPPEVLKLAGRTVRWNPAHAPGTLRLPHYRELVEVSQIAPSLVSHHLRQLQVRQPGNRA